MLAKVAKRTLRIISTSSQKWPGGFPASPSLGSEICASGSLGGMVARKVRGAKDFQSANLIQTRWNILRKSAKGDSFAASSSRIILAKAGLSLP
jgi:hypothetical protein